MTKEAIQRKSDTDAKESERALIFYFGNLNASQTKIEALTVASLDDVAGKPVAERSAAGDAPEEIFVQLPDIFRKALRLDGRDASAADIERAIEANRNHITTATIELKQLHARRVDALIEGDGSAARSRKRIAELREEVMDLEAADERLRANLETVRFRETEQARRDRHAAALAQRDATLKVLRARMPKHIREHFALLRMIEECRAEVDAANADAPAGAAYIADPEELLRDLAGAAEELLSEERETIWVRTDIFPHPPIDPDRVRNFRDLGGGLGEFTEATNRVGGQSYRVQTDQIIPCLGSVRVKRRIRSADLGEIGPRLRKLRMPGLRWNEPGYEPPPWHNPSPSDVLEALDRAEVSVSAPDRRSPPVRVVETSEPLP